MDQYEINVFVKEFEYHDTTIFYGLLFNIAVNTPN